MSCCVEQRLFNGLLSHFRVYYGYEKKLSTEGNRFLAAMFDEMPPLKLKVTYPNKKKRKFKAEAPLPVASLSEDSRLEAGKAKPRKGGPSPSKVRYLYAFVYKALVKAKKPAMALVLLKNDPEYKDLREGCKQHKIELNMAFIKRAQSQQYRDRK
jgi:hypothetical protein